MVGFGDDVRLDGSESMAKALASLPQEIERVGGGTPRSSALWIGPMLFDEMRLKSSSDFIGSLKGMVDSLVAGSVVNHAGNVSTRTTPASSVTWLTGGMGTTGRTNTSGYEHALI